MKTQFLGLSLAGGKTEKTAAALIEYFAEQKRLFVSELVPKLLIEEPHSGDERVISWVNHYTEAKSLVVDVPLSLPPCFNCACTRPSTDPCERVDVKWMYQKHQDKKQRPWRPLTPYTQRPIDYFLSHLDGHHFEIGHVLGSNLAPLVARARYLTRHWKPETFETPIKVSAYLLGRRLKLGNSILFNLYQSVGGEDSRRTFMKAWIDQSQLFLYKQDLKSTIENYHAFSAVLSAYMGYLYFNQQSLALPEMFIHEKIVLPTL